MRLPTFSSSLLALALSLSGTASHADEENIDFSYAKNATTAQLTQTVEGLSAWARGELAEHEMEGLFKNQADEQAIIKQSIELAAQLLAQAQEAEKQGDTVGARTHYYAAEAVARYAAHMPHLLEDRLADNN